ncbi:MAG: hypothetical protein IJ390_01535, partial [Lachnospiraceae bacterium]|nr:hypothetical protein [Lachnospiraceae bacterium]
FSFDAYFVFSFSHTISPLYCGGDGKDKRSNVQWSAEMKNASVRSFAIMLLLSYVESWRNA